MFPFLLEILLDLFLTYLFGSLLPAYWEEIDFLPKDDLETCYETYWLLYFFSFFVWSAYPWAMLFFVFLGGDYFAGCAFLDWFVRAELNPSNCWALVFVFWFDLIYFCWPDLLAIDALALAVTESPMLKLLKRAAILCIDSSSGWKVSPRTLAPIYPQEVFKFIEASVSLLRNFCTRSYMLLCENTVFY